jgi:hypothetical protein
MDRLGRGSGYVIAECDRILQDRLRSNFPTIKHRRLRA